MTCLNTNTGSYLPGFFVLKLDMEKQIPPINEMDKDTLDVFFHEYVHYLQDIITSIGYHNFYTINEYVRSVLNRIYKIEEKEFHLPYRIEDNDDNVLANINLQRIVNGDAESVRRFEIRHIQSDAASVYQIPSVRRITVTSKTGDKRAFGAVAIKESMAYLLEETCGNLIKSPDYPYDIARIVTRRYSCEIANDPVKLIALCDMSLMCSNPASVFISFLDMVKKKRIKLSKAEDIVDWFYSQEYQSWDQKPVHFLDYFNELHKVSLNSLTSYIKGIELGKEVERYFTDIFNKVLDLRTNDRYFMIRLAREGDCIKNKTFQMLVATLGFPILKNNNEEHFLFPSALGDASFLQYFSALAEIISLLSKGTDSCGMYKWCKQSPDSTPNYYCLYSPWKKATETKLCPYAFLWRHWGLAPYTPVLLMKTIPFE